MNKFEWHKYEFNIEGNKYVGWDKYFGKFCDASISEGDDGFRVEFRDETTSRFRIDLYGKTTLPDLESAKEFGDKMWKMIEPLKDFKYSKKLDTKGWIRFELKDGKFKFISWRKVFDDDIIWGYIGYNAYGERYKIDVKDHNEPIKIHIESKRDRNTLESGKIAGEQMFQMIQNMREVQRSLGL